MTSLDAPQVALISIFVAFGYQPEASPLYMFGLCGGQRTLNKIQVHGLSCLCEEA